MISPVLRARCCNAAGPVFRAFPILVLAMLSLQQDRGFVAHGQSRQEPSSSQQSPAPLKLNPRYSFSSSYQRPISKQGVSEVRTSMTRENFDRRYAKLKSMGAAYRQYNLWWSELEDSGAAGSSAPLSCASGYQRIPADDSERLRLGYHHFHCINRTALSIYDNLFSRDQESGMQSGVVLWSSPPVYRYPNCLGFSFGGDLNKDGCVPRDDAMDDFEDYVNRLAFR